MTEPLRCGIIGAGRIAWLYDGGAWDGVRSVSHSACFDRHPRTRLVAIYDPVEEARAALAGHSQDGDFTIHADLGAFFAQELDLVAIASPSAHHGDHIRLCLEAGIRYLWIEKPVTLVLEEFIALRNICREMHAPPRIVVNYPRRFLPQTALFRARVQASEAVQAVELAYSRRLDVNGVHMLDLLGAVFEISEPPVLDWVRPGGGANPQFGLTLGGMPVTVTGYDLPYHLIEMRAVMAEGRLSLTRGGAHLAFEPKAPHPDYPGFFQLAPPASLAVAFDAEAALRDATWLALENLLDEAVSARSTIETAYFAQALMEAVLQEADR